METPFLESLLLIFFLIIAVLLVCNKLRIPSIVGFLFTGVIAGPHGLKFISEGTEIEALATMGIMLLLFNIGLEFSLKRLMELKRYFFLGGAIQVLLTTLAGWGLGLLLERPPGESLFFGVLLAMSSTAIVLKILETYGESEGPQGKACLGVLVFQDVIAIPAMMLAPVLGQAEGQMDYSLILHLLFGIGVISVVVFIASKVIPTILYHVAKARSRELFLFSVLTICISVAWVAASIGLSLIIGAFLAGLVIAESEYSHEAIGNIMPLQDVFASLFFVSIGLLLDLEFVLKQPFLILSLTLGIIALKAILAAITGLFLGLPIRICIVFGLALSQVGEFSFVLAKAGYAAGLGDQTDYQIFIAVALLTMALSPAMIRYANPIARLLLKLPLPAKLKNGWFVAPPATSEKQDHVVIIGFGVAGKNLARASKNADLPYTVLEVNAETVRHEKRKGEPIFYGDASHESVLHHVGAEKAKAIAIMINDPPAARRIVSLVRKLNPEAYLIVRTRYVREMNLMYELGANDVIPDEFGTSVEMFVRVLHKYEIPKDKIDGFVTTLRTEGNLLHAVY